MRRLRSACRLQVCSNRNNLVQTDCSVIVLYIRLSGIAGPLTSSLIPRLYPPTKSLGTRLTYHMLLPNELLWQTSVVSQNKYGSIIMPRLWASIGVTCSSSTHPFLCTLDIYHQKCEKKTWLSLASSLEVPQGLPHFPRCSSNLTQAQSLQSSIEKKLQEGTTRQRQENKATQQEDAKLQVKVLSHL